MTQPKSARQLSKHTPGPWEVRGHGDAVGTLNDKVVAPHVYPNNARLIAKAPEMYEMLSGLLKAITKEDEHGSTPLCYNCVQVLSRSISEAHRIKAEIDREG